MTKEKLKSCFVIGPIGAPDTDIRLWSDDIFHNLVEPVASENGYKAFRIIDASRPGDITAQIIEALYKSDLVVADLTGHNPNAFYELAIRHSTGKPFIHMSDNTSSIPFDISPLSTVEIRSNGFAATKITFEELNKHFQSVINDEAVFENPVSRYQSRVEIEKTGTDTDKSLNALRSEVSILRRELSSQQNRSEFDKTERSVNSAYSLMRMNREYEKSKDDSIPNLYHELKAEQDRQHTLRGMNRDSPDIIHRLKSKGNKAPPKKKK